MAIDAEILDRVRSRDPQSMARVLREFYPTVHRVAHGLCGQGEAGHSVTRFVVARSVRVMSGWVETFQPEHWFYHYTVLTARRVARPPPAGADLLLTPMWRDDRPFIAFLAALRRLPRQQQEAFVLSRCERVGLRTCSLAMDCSTEAAGNHLGAAEQSLQLIAGEKFEAFTARVADAYAKLTPSADLIVPAIQRAVQRRRIWPAVVARSLAWAVLGAVVIGLGLLAWYLWKVVEV